MSTRTIRRTRVLVVVIFMVSASLALAGDSFNPPIANWAAPATWSPTRASNGVTTQSDITIPLPFIGVTPCRQYDSRSTTPLAAATNRTVTVTGAPCGIPASAAAVSLNITVFSITGATGNGVFLVGTSGTPTTAWINYPPTETQRGNAGALPLPLVVRVEQGGGSVNFTVDVNGYYGTTPAGGAGMTLNVNTGGYTFFGSNASLTCSGPCGIFSQVLSNIAGVIALEGYTISSASYNNATTGYSNGTQRTDGLDYQNSAGVYGTALHGSAAVNGVAGRVTTSSPYGVGVYGEATNAAANAIACKNTATGVEGFLGTSFGGTSYGLYTNGYIHGSNIAATISLGLLAPHPDEPSSQINYVAVAAPTADVYFRGTARLANGYARIEVPDHFRLSARADSYMTTVTAVGGRVSLSVESEGPDGIEVRGTGNVAFHYVVYAERDALRDHQPVETNTSFTPEALSKGNLPNVLPEAYRQALIHNGTLNPDGTFNQRTAERLGWTIPEPQPQAVSSGPAAPPAKN